MGATVVSILTRAHGARPCLDGAAAACRAIADRRLKVLHVQVPLGAILVPEEVITAGRRAVFEKKHSRTKTAVQRIFDEWRSSSKIDFEASLTHVVGPITSVLKEHATDANLIVVARTDDPLYKQIVQACFGANFLLLIVPPGTAVGDFRHLLIASTSDDRGKRATLAALPWLSRAEKITVLHVRDSKGARGASIGSPPELQAIGVNTNLIVADCGNRTIGQAILREAHRLRADAIVIGAHQRTRLIQMLVRGGVSRDLMVRTALPLLT
jgi:nucleotide-binding universal stress UspA family protein